MQFEKKNNSFLFQYGPAAGLGDFRKALSGFLSANYKCLVDEDSLILTAGATNGMHLILTVLLNPTSLIIVDEVTYMIALESFANFPGFKVVSVPLESDGPDLEAFRKIIETNDMPDASGGRFNCMYYTIPNHHNPTGLTFSKQKCKDLVLMSRKYNFLITCDDVYNLLNYNDNTAKLPLYCLDNPKDVDYKGTILSNGSFSKILAPGVRVGWLQCPNWAWRVLDNR